MPKGCHGQFTTTYEPNYKSLCETNFFLNPNYKYDQLLFSQSLPTTVLLICTGNFKLILVTMI